MSKLKIALKNLDAIIFDFDGVLTDNRVLLDEHGKEYVTCHRGDGLAFDVFRKLDVDVVILSTEKNPIVTARAEKLKVPVLQGISNKVEVLNQYVMEKDLDFTKLLYVGNDLNDYRAMKLCGYSACPADSHKRIKEIATVTLKMLGGQGIARELLEEVLQLDIIEVLYSN
jgi:3-deoxy-D-manno-octulosonate 8-phosphate phosphatase (KDO 8-P phosphatase)